MNITDNEYQPAQSLPRERATAKAQLRQALNAHGFPVMDHRDGENIWIENAPFEKHRLWVRGGEFDGTVVVNPRRRHNRAGWGLRTDITMFFPPGLGARGADIVHEDAARKLRNLDFTAEIQQVGELWRSEGRENEHRGSQWTRVVETLEEAAAVVLGVLAIQCEHWPGFCEEPEDHAIPLSTDQYENLAAMGVLAEGGLTAPICPVVRATDDFYWLRPLTKGASWCLFGPDSALVASVYFNGSWFIWNVQGDPIDLGRSESVEAAKHLSEKRARALFEGEQPSGSSGHDCERMPQ